MAIHHFLSVICSSSLKLAFHDADTDTDILAKILADTSDTRDFQKLFLWQAERHADILATILARMSVSVSTPWNASLTTSLFCTVTEILPLLQSKMWLPVTFSFNTTFDNYRLLTSNHNSRSVWSRRLASRSSPTNMAASRPVEWRHFDVILLKSTAAIFAAAMFVGDRTTASTSLAGAAAVVHHYNAVWARRPLITEAYTSSRTP